MRESDYLMRIERDRAKERQGTRTDIVPTLAQCEDGKTRDIVAKKIGMSHGTFDKARTIWEKVKGQITKEFQNGSRKPPLWMRFEPLFPLPDVSYRHASERALKRILVDGFFWVRDGKIDPFHTPREKRYDVEILVLAGRGEGIMLLSFGLGGSR